jgi:hypothetical protein
MYRKKSSRDVSPALRGVRKTLKPEDLVQLAWVEYMKLQYPKAIFFCNILSGVKLPIVVALRAKLLGSPKHTPDCVILEPRGPYHGLLIELKRECDKEGKPTKLFTRSGAIRVQHLEQHLMIGALKERGYYATFAVGFEEARRITDYYFSLS